jgi:hypothetical protein
VAEATVVVGGVVGCSGLEKLDFFKVKDEVSR